MSCRLWQSNRNYDVNQAANDLTQEFHKALGFKIYLRPKYLYFPQISLEKILL